jgi:hypothetical protein
VIPIYLSIDIRLPLTDTAAAAASDACAAAVDRWLSWMTGMLLGAGGGAGAGGGRARALSREAEGGGEGKSEGEDNRAQLP